jgi:hypothetical protein
VAREILLTSEGKERLERGDVRDGLSFVGSASDDRTAGRLRE